MHLVTSVVDSNKYRTACAQKIPMYGKYTETVVWNLGTFIYYERAGASMCEACSEVPEVQMELLKRVKL